MPLKVRVMEDLGKRKGELQDMVSQTEKAVPVLSTAFLHVA
jgi:predicted membrane GTPase involved in stress response